MALSRVPWSVGAEFVAALRSSVCLSAHPAEDFHLLWTGWPIRRGLRLGLGDLLPHGGRSLHCHAYVDGDLVLRDLVHPDDLWVYTTLAARRPVGRAQRATVLDRELCLLLAAAYFW